MSTEPMSPNEERLWDEVNTLKAQVAELQRQLQQHYSSHQVMHNVFLDQGRLVG